MRLYLKNLEMSSSAGSPVMGTYARIGLTDEWNLKRIAVIRRPYLL